MTVSNTSVLIVGDDFTDFPEARQVAVGAGMSFVDQGTQGEYIISAGGALLNLANNSTDGYISFNSNTNTYTSRSFSGQTGISITRPDGVGGNTVISQMPSTVVQRVNVINSDGDVIGDYSDIQFKAGSGIGITITNFGAGAKAIVTIAQDGQSGTVSSVNADSQTGVLLTGVPITTSGTMHVNLPGTGASDAVIRGDILIGGVNGKYVPLPIAGNFHVLTSDGTDASWQPATNGGTVTSIDLSSSDAFITISGNPITTAGTLAMTINTLSVDKGGTGLVSVTDHCLLIGNDASALTILTNGTTGQLLRATTDDDPAWWTNSPTYIVQTADATNVPNAQALGALVTGIVKNTTATGVLSIAVEGTDYWAPGGTPVNVASGGTGLASVAANSLVLGAGTSALTVLANGTTGQYLRATTSSDPAWTTNTTKFIIQTADTDYGSAQVLGSLATGIVINTTTTGVLSIATEGTDYWKPGGTPVNVASGGTGLASVAANSLVLGAGTSALTVLSNGTTGQLLRAATGADPAWWTNSPTYIVQTADATNVPNAQALGALATGMVKNTTTTGVLSIGVEGTDYWKPGGTPVNVASGGTGLASVAANSLVLGAGTSALTVLANGTTGQYLRATTSSNPAWTTNTTKFIIQTASSDYGSAQVLGSLATGIVKNTTTTGVLSIATEGTDYWKPGGTSVSVNSGGTGLASWGVDTLLIGAIGGTVSQIAVGATNTVLKVTGAAQNVNWSTPYKSAGIATIANAQSSVTVVTSTTGFTTIMLTKIQQGGGAMGATNKTLVANVDTITANDFRIFLDANTSGSLDVCWMIW